MSVAAPERVDLPVSGMTCASCARTIERTLAGTAGVERARVNLATNTATIEYHRSEVQVADFIAAIEDLGYGVPKTAARPDAAEPVYRRRLAVAAILAALVMALGMAHRWPCCSSHSRRRWSSTAARPSTWPPGARRATSRLT